MADNAILSAAIGVGITAALDDIGGVHYPRSKIVIGADGVNDGDVSAANPLPITVASIPSHAVTNVGTFAVQVTSAPTTAVTNAALAVTGGGSEATALRVTIADDSTGSLSVDDGGGLISIDDGGGTITVDGTVAITHSALAISGGGAEASALRVTIASDSTGLISVDDNGGSLSVDDGGGSITIDGTVAITSAPLAVTGGGVEASALRVTIASDSTGVVSVDDNGGTLSIDDGGGSITVDGTFWQGTQPVSNAGTFAVQVDGSALTALQLIDDPIATIGGVPLNRVAIYDAGGAQITSFGGGTQYTEGDTDATITGTAAMMEVAANTLQPIQGTVADGLLVNLGSNNDVTVSGTVTANIGTVGTLATAANQTTLIGHVDGLEGLLTTIDADTGTLAAIDFATGADVASLGVVGGGTEATAVRVTIASDSTGLVSIDDGGGSITIDGTVAVSGTVTVGAHEVTIAAAQTLATVTTVSTVTTCSTVTTLTGSGVAHDAADSGNPHKIGARAVTSVSGQTPVAANDRTDLFAGVDGVLITRQHSNLEDVVQERTTNTDGASTAFTSGLAAPGAGLRLWITGICLANSSATDITVDLRDGAAGSVLWTLSVPAGGGNNWPFNPPLRLSANTALAFDGSAAVTTLSVSANGFKSKV